MKVDEQNLINEIENIKKSLGKRLVILGHYYQRKEIVALSDFKGDSFALARQAAHISDAQYIIFCGVHFMAESAAVLAQPHQVVQLPALDAGCPMADMANYDDVLSAWHTITGFLPGIRVTPITYMNSSAQIKSFCGQHDGAVCTSSNADKLFRWAFDRGEKIFFLPDEHLGRNTANMLGILPDECVLWDPGNPDKCTPEDLIRAKVILWQGYCHVHTFFTTDHIKHIRTKFPEAVIIAHPECREEVISMVDYSGSTKFIDDYVRQAPSGSTIAIATELNMVDRLATQYPDKTVIEVARSLCPNMFKINLSNLRITLDNPGKRNIVRVPRDISKYAEKSLRTMIEVVTSYQ